MDTHPSNVRRLRPERNGYGRGRPWRFSIGERRRRLRCRHFTQLRAVLSGNEEIVYFSHDLIDRFVAGQIDGHTTRCSFNTATKTTIELSPNNTHYKEAKHNMIITLFHFAHRSRYYSGQAGDR